MIVRSRASLALLSLAVVGACSSGASAPTTAELTHRYLAIANPANHVLDESFDALADHAGDVRASAGLLRTIAATERQFDRDLLGLKLPGQLGATARAMVAANEARANLTAQAVTATDATSLHTYEYELTAMNVPVETQVRVLRKGLGLPPPETS